jgi:hypothetical protein
VLEKAVVSVLNDLGWEHEGFALAEGFDAKTGRYPGLAAHNAGAFGQITDSTLVVQPSLAREQRAAEYASESAVEDEGGRLDCEPSSTRVLAAPMRAVEAPVQEPRDVRFFGVVRVNPERYGRDFTRVAQEVLQHLAAVDGTRLEVTLEITATNDAGFPPEKSRVVTENARTLKFDQFGFEDG